MTETIESLVTQFDQVSSQIRLWHWQTMNSPEHEYLGEFYEEWNKLIDRFVESYAGKYGRPASGITGNQCIPYQRGLPYTFLVTLADFLESDDVRGIGSQKDTWLRNILDEIIGLVYHTKFKLSLVQQ